MHDIIDITPNQLSEERLRLEREAIAIERERLAAARAHAEAEARLARPRHPFLGFVSVVLLALLCFVGGLLSGIAFMEQRQQRQRDNKLARALSQLDAYAAEGEGATNGTATAAGEAHHNVKVVVIQ